MVMRPVLGSYQPLALALQPVSPSVDVNTSTLSPTFIYSATPLTACCIDLFTSSTVIGSLGISRDSSLPSR